MDIREVVFPFPALPVLPANKECPLGLLLDGQFTSSLTGILFLTLVIEMNLAARGFKALPLVIILAVNLKILKCLVHI